MAGRDIRTVVLGLARPNIWDIIALILVIGAMVMIAYGGEQTVLPLTALEVAPVSLDPANLPHYALRTTMRMLLAMACSTVFSFIYATLAAKSRRAEMVLIPLLDILQAVQPRKSALADAAGRHFDPATCAFVVVARCSVCSFKKGAQI